jgi:hypothetical protein
MNSCGSLRHRSSSTGGRSSDKHTRCGGSSSSFGGSVGVGVDVGVAVGVGVGLCVGDVVGDTVGVGVGSPFPFSVVTSSSGAVKSSSSTSDVGICVKAGAVSMSATTGAAVPTAVSSGTSACGVGPLPAVSERSTDTFTPGGSVRYGNIGGGSPGVGPRATGGALCGRSSSSAAHGAAISAPADTNPTAAAAPERFLT